MLTFRKVQKIKKTNHGVTETQRFFLLRAFVSPWFKRIATLQVRYDSIH